jgi:hypothetical protein
VPTVTFKPDWVIMRSSGPEIPLVLASTRFSACTPLRRSTGRSSVPTGVRSAAIEPRRRLRIAFCSSVSGRSTKA